jgi:predicted peroxiredoxin
VLNVSQVIQSLVGQGVKAVVCGKSHTLALTEAMEVTSGCDV